MQGEIERLNLADAEIMSDKRRVTASLNSRASSGRWRSIGYAGYAGYTANSGPWAERRPRPGGRTAGHSHGAARFARSFASSQKEAALVAKSRSPAIPPAALQAQSCLRPAHRSPRPAPALSERASGLPGRKYAYVPRLGPHHIYHAPTLVASVVICCDTSLPARSGESSASLLAC